MSTASTACGDASGAPLTLAEAFEPAATKLAHIWMAISDVGGTLGRVVNDHAPHELGDHAATLQRELKRMDELVFSSIEAMDDLLTLVREDLAGRAVNTVLAVNALDAYLDGVAKLPPATVSRGVQTDERVGTSATVVTPSPSPMAAGPKLPQMSSIKMFDVLRGLYRQRELKPKLEVKTDTTPSSSGKKRARSPASTNGDQNRSHKKREYNRKPKDVIQDRRPIAVHGVRERYSQREYAVKFEGVEEPVWLVTRGAPPAVKALIHAYTMSQRKKLDQEYHKSSAVTATQTDPEEANGDDVESDLDADGIYIVEKIVDHRFRYGKKQYFVKWDGYDTDENTWEPAAKLRSEVRNIVDDYERDLAKAAARKVDGQAPSNAAPVKALRRKSTTGPSGEAKPIALGRPSNPSALTKSTPARSSAELLQRSGKIPKVQFQVNEVETDDEEDVEDSDLERTAPSDEEDSDDDEDSSADEESSADEGRSRGGGKGYGYKGASVGKKRIPKALSPHVE